MLRLVVDLLLRVVGPEVALAAVLGLAGPPRREVVPAVAGRAGSARAVEIEPADAGIGPAGAAEERLAALVAHDAADGVHVGGLPLLIRLEVAHGHEAAVAALERHERAVTLLAAGIGWRQSVHGLHGPARRRRVRIERGARALDRLGQKVVERCQDVAGFRMMAGRELRRFGGMAPGAVARGDDSGDLLAVVAEDVGVFRLRLVAVDARHALLGVGRAGPVLDDAGRHLRVAVDALPRGRRRRDRGAGGARLVLPPCHFEPLHRHQREQEQEAQAADDPAFLIECHTVILSARRALPTS